MTAVIQIAHLKVCPIRVMRMFWGTKKTVKRKRKNLPVKMRSSLMSVTLLMMIRVIKRKRKKGKKKKSGINSKASDRVKFPQQWPQSYLQFEYVNKQLKFDELDFKQLIAGEIEIIGEKDLSKSERKGRLDMLKKIVYYSSIYEFRGLKAFFAAWVRDIERGIKKWSDDSSYLETAMLSKFVRNKGFQARKDEQKGAKSDGKSDGSDKVWFCSE